VNMTGSLGGANFTEGLRESMILGPLR
jgi:hypothetical protein